MISAVQRGCECATQRGVFGLDGLPLETSPPDTPSHPMGELEKTLDFFGPEKPPENTQLRPSQI